MDERRLKSKASRMQIIVLWAAVAFFLVAFGLQLWSAPPEPGIVGLELALSKEKASQILLDWCEPGRAQAILNLKLDYVFIAAYVGLLITLIWLAANRSAGWALSPKILVGATGLAGVLDGIENYLLLGILQNPETFADHTVWMATGAAWTKFALLSVVVGTVVIRWASGELASESRKEDVEEFAMRHGVFLHSARSAARQALYFADMLYPTTKRSYLDEESAKREKRGLGPLLKRLLYPGTKGDYNDKIESYWEPALHQVKGLVRGVYVPSDTRDDSQIQDFKGKSSMEDQERLDHAASLGNRWQALADSLDDEKWKKNYPFDQVANLRDELKSFLTGSRSGGGTDVDSPTHRVGMHWATVVVKWVERHVALLLAIALIAHVSFRVEAVNGLLRNEGWMLLAFLVILPLSFYYYTLQVILLRRTRAGVVHPWGIGRRPFWALVPRVSAPGRLIKRWSGGSSLLPAIARGQFLKFLGYMTVAFVGLSIVYSVREFRGFGSTPTVPIVLLLFYAILLIANQLDFWDFLSAYPIRFTLLCVLTLILVLLRFGLGRQGFLTLFAVLALMFVFYFFRIRPRKRFLLVAGVLCTLVVLGLWQGGRTYERRIWRLSPESLQPAWVEALVRSEELSAGEAKTRYGVVVGQGEATRKLRAARCEECGHELCDFQRLTKNEWPWPYQVDHVQDVPPVVVMAASGGGSRASVYAALTLEGLNGHFPEGSGFLQKDVLKKNIPVLKEIGENIQLISSVSGGSLANAAYVVRKSDCGGSNRIDRLVEAVSRDFLFPTLMGALLPGTSRGEAIENEWRRDSWRDQETVALGDCTLGGLTELWRDHKGLTPPFPIPMFNTSTLDGHRLVISPLSHESFTRLGIRGSARGTHNAYLDPDHNPDPTWVFYRDGIYSLEDLLLGRDLLMSSAVLASANFPFGFPVVKVDLSGNQSNNGRPLHFSPQVPNPQIVKLTDGGAISNSGMWSLYQLLVENHEVLKRRGVLLIIVEASKMPEYSGFASTFNSLLGTLRDQGGIARGLHERMFEHLENLYDGTLAMSQIDLVPKEELNIMTTWALDDRSLSRLENESFSKRWDEEAPLMAKKWIYLKCLRAGSSDDSETHTLEARDQKCRELSKLGDEPLISRERVPLD